MEFDPTKYMLKYVFFEEVSPQFWKCIPCNQIYDSTQICNHSKRKKHHDNCEKFLDLDNLIKEFTPEI